MTDFVSASIVSVDPLATVEPEICATTAFVMTLAPTMAETAALPEAAMLSPKEVMWDESVAESVTSLPDRTSDPPVISASTSLVMTLPNPVAWIATFPAAPTPTVIAMMAASERAVAPKSPSLLRIASVPALMPARTVESSTCARTSLVTTLPMREAPTATLPEPATLTMIARMLASGSRGDPSRAASSCACWSAESIHEGRMPGATSEAERATSPPAMTVEFPLIAAVTSLATALPRADTETATSLPPETPMPRARMIDEETESSVTFAAVFVTVVPAALTPARTVEPDIAVPIAFVMTLAEMAPPPAMEPEPAPPKARASMTEASTAERATVPFASTVEPLRMAASIVLLIVLTEMPTPAANFPPPAPPTVMLMTEELLVVGNSIPDVPRPMPAGSAGASGAAMPAARFTPPAVEVTDEPSMTARMSFSM
ncbi:MAG: hypothetical protein A4E73_00364 [Syntrophaceae bacterium PtaU1.Bin231]|nr:MAG: hypothetical protein A4E73_00364 [Syntrophaceae bacterium PtaU1.Bin231]